MLAEAEPESEVEYNLSCLTQTSQMNIVNDNGNKYLFNGDTNYNSNLKYGLYNGTYTITNVPIGHPIALLNTNKSNISYTVDDSEIIEIKVSGGVFSPNSNNDYFTFTDSNDNSIGINNGSFKFMRGKTYRFTVGALGFYSNHVFQIYCNEILSTLSTTVGESMDITISSNHSTVSGHLYYRCQPHSEMKANIKLLYKEIVEADETTGSYDFYYGTVNITVSGDFNEVSAYCYHHGYMGGKNLLVYSDTCILD